MEVNSINRQSEITGERRGTIASEILKQKTSVAA